MSTTGDPGSRRATAPYRDQHAGQHAQQARTMQEKLNEKDNLRRRGNQAPVRIHPDDDPERFDYFYLQAVLTTRTGDAGAVGEELVEIGVPPVRRQDGVPIDGVTTFTLPDDSNVDSVCDRLDDLLRPGVAMPDHVVHVTPTGCCPATEPIPWEDGPTPPVVPDGKAGKGVKVVVVDSGRLDDVERDHPWLKKPAITGDTEDGFRAGHYRGHGTFVCGVLRTQAPATDIDMNALRFIAGAVVESDLAAALEEALTKDKPAVISMSAGTTTRKGLPPIALSVICERLGSVVLVAAAGNDGDTEPFYPAYFSQLGNANVVSVGALGPEGALAAYSNYEWPLVYARGSSVVNAYPTSPAYVYEEPPRRGGPDATFRTGFANWDGTSFATPMVAGRIAARMTAARESAQDAWADLYREARANRGADSGPRLFP